MSNVIKLLIVEMKIKFGNIVFKMFWYGRKLSLENVLVCYVV